MASMFRWLRQKVAATRYRLSIALHVRKLVAISNQVDECVQQTGRAGSADIDRVWTAQRRLLDYIVLGLANRLSFQDIEGTIGEELARETVGNGARMAVEHVLHHARGELEQAA